MLRLFSKQLDLITAEDVRQLKVEGYPEGDTVEFKETLPAPGRKVDPWMDGGDKIGVRARDEILKEVIAFANAHGGHFFLGIAETDKHPHCARAITPVPRCADLAARLRHQIRDCIEPQLPMVGVVGVPTEDGDEGVVVIRVPESRAAPHRLMETRHCYARRSDSSEKMSMREIQDLTLQRYHWSGVLEAKFADSRELFGAQVRTFNEQMGDPAVQAVRVTLIPMDSSLHIEKVYRNLAVQAYWEELAVRFPSAQHNLTVPSVSSNRRPMLRGFRDRNDGPNFTVHREVNCSGTVEYWLFDSATPNDETPPCLHMQWILGVAANAILTANRFRLVAGAPETEYGMEIEISSEGCDLVFSDFLGQRHPAHPNPLRLPRYSLGGRDEIEGLIDQVVHDLFEATGNDLQETLTLPIDPKLVE